MLPNKLPTRFLQLVDEAKSHIQQTDVKTVKAWQDNGEAFHLIDVREQREWTSGKIPGAKLLSKGMLECSIEKLIPAIDEKIVVYCSGGYRSALAADSLQKMGYRNVMSMDGGFDGWKAAGYSLEK